MTCKEAARILSLNAGQNSVLPLRERFALHLHLLICHACKAFSEQLKMTTTLLKTLMNEKRQEFQPDEIRRMEELVLKKK